MGQEETRRRCQMSGRRRRARENRLTKIFTSYKGDAIMKKRIIALVLACMLICSIAVTASAATATYSGRYGNCLYATTTDCATRSCSGLIEATPLNGTTAEDYELMIYMVTYKSASSYYEHYGDVGIGMATIGCHTVYNIYKAWAIYFINDYVTHNETVYPS